MALTVTYNRTHVHSDFRTNHSNIGDQFAPDVLGLSDGGFVSAYNNPGSGIELQFYNAGFNGMLGLLPFDGITLAAGQPSLTQLANGNVLVVWDENDQTNDPD